MKAFESEDAVLLNLALSVYNLKMRVFTKYRHLWVESSSFERARVTL